MTSSDWQLEQTGVDREARRLTICAGPCFELNGLRSKASLIFSFPAPKAGTCLHFNSEMMGVSRRGSIIDVDRGALWRAEHMSIVGLGLKAEGK
jgi:hypothetical protein